MAIDSQGRYDFDTLTERTRRLCNAFTATLDQSGNEVPTPPLIEDQNISNVDIQEQLNSSLMTCYSSILQDTAQLFAKIIHMDVVAGQHRYSLPAGTIQLITLKMLPSARVSSPTSPRPNEWKPIYEYDEDNLDTFNPSANGSISFRRDDDTIVLSEIPVANISQGFQLRVVQIPPMLTKPTDVCSTSLARFIQEYICYDAAFVLCDTRLKAVPESVASGRTEWHERVVRAAENMNHPRFTQLRSSRMVRMTYTGR